MPRMCKTLDGTDEGMDWSWDHSQFIMVDWKAILKNIPDHMRGDMIRGNHVCRMTLEPVHGMYDNQRRNMRMKCKHCSPYPDDVPVPVWGWHLLVSDGEVYRLHTDWRGRKPKIVKVVPNRVYPPEPKPGKNQSDGPAHTSRTSWAITTRTCQLASPQLYQHWGRKTCNPRSWRTERQCISPSRFQMSFWRVSRGRRVA